MKSFWILGACVLGLAACSSSVGDGTGGSSSTGTKASGTGGAGGSYMPPEGSSTVVFGPVDVPAGVEKTQCVTKRLGNMGTIHVNQIHNQLIGVSHHMIVYKVADTVEQTTPYDCKPFTATADPTKGAPLMITQKHDETLTLPAGVAFTLDPNQMIRLEMHYINPTQQAASIEGRATFVPMADADFKDEAGFLFSGSPDINLAPNATATLDQFMKIPADLVGKSFFGFTGHEHQYGTGVTVSVATGKTDPGTPAYAPTNFSWSEPPTEYHDPPIVIPEGSGFHFVCNWNNTGTSTVKFGESANDEMCFFWAYYYPSVGARVCVHTDQIPGGYDTCCPGGPQAICSKL
jgi:hypothetical protein